jgi:hypothetical protein
VIIAIFVMSFPLDGFAAKITAPVFEFHRFIRLLTGLATGDSPPLSGGSFPVPERFQRRPEERLHIPAGD